MRKIVVVAVLAALTACSKNEPPAADNKASTQQQPQETAKAKDAEDTECLSMKIECLMEKDRAAAKAAQSKLKEAIAAKIASTPKPDFNTPESEYKEISSGYDATAYRVAYGAKISDEDLVSGYNAAFREQDQFKKKEMVAKFTSDLNAKVSSISNNRYVVIRNNLIGLDPYDFEKKSFALHNIGKGTSLSLMDQQTNYQTKIDLENADGVSEWSVPDEAMAKQLESGRATYKINLRGDFYGYIVGGVPGPGKEKEILMTVTKLVIYGDNSKKPLVTLTPPKQ